MRKLKQILAGFLAMNLTISAASTGMINVSASEEYSGEGVYDEMYAEEGVQMYAEEAAAPEEVVSETEAAYYSSSSDIAVEAEVPEAPLETESSTPVPETPATTASVETPENTTVTQTPQESTSESISNQVPESSSMTSSLESEESSLTEQSTEEKSEEEELSSEEASSEEESTEEEMAVFTARSTVSGQLHVNQFKNYTKDETTGVESVEINSEKELILLSNCDPKELQTITIHINMTGQIDLTEKNNIKSGQDISEWITNLSVVSTVSDSEEQSIDENSVETEQALKDSVDASGNTGSSNLSEDGQSNVAVQEETVTAGEEYSFQGIGSVECPFRGKIIGNNIPWYVERTLFGGLSSKAEIYSENNPLNIQWYGNGKMPMLAEVYLMESAASEDGSADSPKIHTLNVSIKQGETVTAMGTLIDTVKADNGCKDDILQIGNIVTYGDATVKSELSTGNAGLICNTLESGKISLNGYGFPSTNYTVNSTAIYNTTDTSAAGNAGGVIGVMKNGTSLSIESEVTVNETLNSTGNAGGLVGLMEEGATIAVSNNATVDYLQLTAGASAGGVVGLMQKGAKITTVTSATVTLSSPSVTGNVSAGGVVGTAEDVIFADSDMQLAISVSSPTVTGNASGATVGGFIGSYTLNAENLTGDDAGTEPSLSLPRQVTITYPTLTVSNNGVAGGYFGYLHLNGKLTYTIGNSENTNWITISPTYTNCNAEAIGAIAGKVTSTDIASTLLIQNVSVSATNNSNSKIQRHGGLVGELGTKANAGDNAYLKVSNVEIKVTNPYATDEKEKGYGFGGIVGLLAQGSILQIENTITISTENNTAINRGGGLVGYAEKSVINVSGMTDLSEILYAKGSGKNSNDPKTGWLVGWQDSALIYANGDGNGNGWSYIRGKEKDATKQAMNDIGNYGQIIRLHSIGSAETEKSKLSSNLITIDVTNHKISYMDTSAPTVDQNSITLVSADAFALLSICWNTRGNFGGVTGITSENFNTTSPKSKNITLSADIDLTGSGITGLSRDTSDENDIYSGIFDGNGYSITLAIGETFGFGTDKKTLAVKGDDGYGEVISAGEKYHGRQGLFAKISNATVKNFTVDGNINISNAGQDILAGGIAGEIAGKNSITNVLGVTVKESITADCTNNQFLGAGGFFGGSYNSNIKVTFKKLDLDTSIRKNIAESLIEVKNSTDNTDDKRINIGELIGEVGESPASFDICDFVISGNITTDAKKRAYVGGLIGVIKGNNRDTQSANHTINIKNVEFSDFTITASNATEVCGGLLGSIWLTVAVFINDKIDSTSEGLTVTNTTINAASATSVGGLAYRSSGKWEIQDNGINLKKLSINAGKDLGLLVCKGEKNTEQVGNQNDRTVGALYLYTTNWDNSYQIDQNNVSINVTKKGVFDEFVAYTTSSPSAIFDNNKNGVISIATQDVTAEDGTTSRVGVDLGDTCTTYQNRTTYGQSYKINAYSRYYYDLDQCVTDVKNLGKDQQLSTPQELLLWSVYNYACGNIKSYFGVTTDITTKPDGPWAIGGDTKQKLDMSKYSYYPIKVEDVNVNVTETELVFNNEHIQTVEADNKSTQGTNDVHTQHYAMHCGLFLNSQRNTLTVRDITFSGSIGKVNNSTSGVIVSNFASGNLDGSNAKRMTITIKDITLKGLKVTDCGKDYAPLLINNIADNSGSSYTYGYTKLDIDGVYVKGYENNSTAVASSLIGNVGSSKAKEITMTFKNIVLPDKEANAKEKGYIFSHATLLEHFAYDGTDNASSASYTFYNRDDWNNGVWDHHNVTYGQEITETTEFPNLQLWYYDESTYLDNTGLVHSNSNNFDASSYLPYVCEKYDLTQCKHEIKVNQRVVDIINGCGTYGHPYKITRESEMNILSDYMAGGEPRMDWRVTITSDQSVVHTQSSIGSTNNDVTYQYDGNSWVEVTRASDQDEWKKVTSGKTLPKDFMHTYLLNAYYDIQGKVEQGSDASGTTETTEASDVASGENTSSTESTLTLNNFKGFGTSSYPFRGVITSTNNTTLVLKGETGNGLIPYSYGSVVKNLKITYAETKTLTYNSDVLYYPSVCFGGVIGCVLGGDNIIDNVTVTIPDKYLNLSGEKKHLIQVGGYVGSVSGGGVIFRNMTDGTGLNINNVSGIVTSTNTATSTELYANLYVNPYVGRVLDGFAFYEITASDTGIVASLDNTNKNYQINTLTADPDLNVSMSDNTVTINDAQGLLILSAIVNSGAASKGISNAYSRMGNSDGVAYTANTQNYSFGGRYGKVRNAVYSNIGTSCEDATLSITEDRNLPGENNNLPYLIQKYCGGVEGVFGISTNSEIEIVLLNDANAKFDMTAYGNGYQGIGARYVSNAIRGHIINHPEGVVLELKSFNGNNKTITMDMQVSEYADDDFHVASVGGLFNVLRIYSSAEKNITGTVLNVTIDSSTVQTSIDQQDIEQTQTEQTDQTTKQPAISLKYYNAEGKEAEATWTSSKDVGIGGLAGSLVGYIDTNGNRDIEVTGVQVKNLSITSPASAGGIFGNTGKPRTYTGDRTNSNDIAVLLQPKESQIAYGIAFNQCSYTGLTITGKYAAGGFVGYIGNKDQNPRSSADGFQTNTTTADTDASESTNIEIETTGENSTISATDNSSWAGGLFGYVKTRMFINMTDGGDKKNYAVILQNVAVSAGTAAGGCVGYIDEKCYGIHNVTVKKTANSLNGNISLNSSTTTGTFFAGGIVGYAKGATQNWTPNWTYAGGISNSSIENVQINDENISQKNELVNSWSGLKANYLAGGIIGQISGGKTRIEGCTVTTSKIYGSVAGGIIGRNDPNNKTEIQLVSCSTLGISENNNTKLSGFSTAGGILGFGTGGAAVTIQDSRVQYLNIEGKDWGVGALVGDADSSNGGIGILYLFNSSVQNSTVTASGNENAGGGRWPRVGGIIGNLRSTIKASNLLFSNMTLNIYDGVTDKRKRPGLLFGNVTKSSLNINIAGVSIQNIPKDNENTNIVGENIDNITVANSYIAFADYSGTSLSSSATAGDSQETDAQENSKILVVGNSNDLLGSAYKDKTAEEQKAMIKTDVASPYVVTSPKSALALYDTESDTSPKYLYGDGVAWTTPKTGESSSSGSSSTEGEGGGSESASVGSDTSDSSSTTTSFTVMAKQIWDGRKAVTDGHYAYTKIGSDTFDFTSLIATYNANQTTKVTNDFPVVQLTNGNAEVVQSYLDILTNGAFSVANAMNKKDEIHVTARVDVYSYDSKNNKFVKNANVKSSAFQVNINSGTISFSTTTDYDNDNNRFNLLTVTFTEKDADGNEHHYNVFVPILVRRMLEMDFTATLTYGTDFNKENYSSLTNHVLESFGSSVTGYLTYTYNSDAGTYTDYGWQSYINAGGNVMEMKKSIRFTMSTPKALPKGTQLSLVDENGKVYYYTATGNEKNDGYGIVVPLAGFQSSDGKLYQEPSISELIGATADSTGTKLFVKVDDSGKPVDATGDEEAGKEYPKPTVRLKTTSGYEYYRLAQSGESPEYSITVDESKLQKVEETSTKKSISTVTENYYLVITIPEGANSEALNGSIQTTIESAIPHHVNYLRRDNGDVDGHGSTASTYQLSNGYRQVLTETSNDGVSKKITTADSTMTVNVTDKITFPNSQSYDSRDQLYLRFVGGLQKTLKDAAGNKTTASEQFPKGTTGEVSFYVYTENNRTKTYYVYKNSVWSNVSDLATAVSYTWTSKDGEMELPLATEQPSAQKTTSFISLQGLRDLIKPSSASDGDTTFYVEVKLTATLPASGLDVIPETKLGTDNKPPEYTKLTCSAQLSTLSQSITYSSNRASIQNMTTAYYRDEPAGVQLMYDADLIDQLGINLLDLRYLDAAKEHSLIDTTAIYDLSAMKNLESTLKDSTGIKFTLTLCQKNTASSTEEYGPGLTNSSNYLTVELKTSNSGEVRYDKGTWSWTVPKETYYDKGTNKLKDDAIFSNGKLTQLIQLKVNVNVSDILYSNYKVILTAEILDTNGNTVSDSRKDDNIIYTFAKINPEFVD